MIWWLIFVAFAALAIAAPFIIDAYRGYMRHW